jgi:two-component system alkaline phosphatase synthesis response regulator PhoP
MDTCVILLISSDRTFISKCKQSFGEEDLSVLTVTNQKDALENLSDDFSGIVLLDSVTGENDLLSLCAYITESLKIPVLVIGSDEKIPYLNAGAGAFIQKPVDPDELISQIKTILSKNRIIKPFERSHEFRCGDLYINYNRRLVKIGKKEVALTRKEYILLTELTSNSGTILSYHYLLHTIWGNEYTDEKHYIHQHICRLKKKIESDPRNPVYIQTIYQEGYIFREKD